MRRHPHSRRRENGIDKREQSKAHEQVLYHLRRRSRARNVASEMTSAPRCLPACPSLLVAVSGLSRQSPKRRDQKADVSTAGESAADAPPKEPGCFLGFPREVVGAPGFGPGTSCAQGRRATRLRYAPTVGRKKRVSASTTIGCDAARRWGATLFAPSIPTRGQFSGSKSGSTLRRPHHTRRVGTREPRIAPRPCWPVASATHIDRLAACRGGWD